MSSREMPRLCVDMHTHHVLNGGACAHLLLVSCFIFSSNTMNRYVVNSFITICSLYDTLSWTVTGR
ncbi:hypothetical protein B0H34DRAFT_735726 [Crassisporium funariophilum]|nr:hypothetical protein B0H34DRAFT_735726 [Crassisporium funariophilum]